ncbi:MAG: sugar nucleotide-binding protein, partial [Actinomycetota bacterium]
MTGTLLLAGGAGQLGRACHPAFDAAGWDVVSTDVAELDVRDREATVATVRELGPAVVLNLAAITDADR